MEKIYSKVYPTELLHVIFREQDFVDGRTEIIEPNNYIQCAALKMPSATTFKPHKHVFKPGNSLVVTQESWHVLYGTVECTFYDVDNTVLCSPILHPGDSSFTLGGGHTYTILEENTRVLEYKTGPYTGQTNDKVFI